MKITSQEEDQEEESKSKVERPRKSRGVSMQKLRILRRIILRINFRLECVEDRAPLTVLYADHRPDRTLRGLIEIVDPKCLGNPHTFFLKGYFAVSCFVYVVFFGRISIPRMLA